MSISKEVVKLGLQQIPRLDLVKEGILKDEVELSGLIYNDKTKLC